MILPSVTFTPSVGYQQRTGGGASRPSNHQDQDCSQTQFDEMGDGCDSQLKLMFRSKPGMSSPLMETFYDTYGMSSPVDGGAVGNSSEPLFTVLGDQNAMVFYNPHSVLSRLPVPVIQKLIDPLKSAPISTELGKVLDQIESMSALYEVKTLERTDEEDDASSIRSYTPVPGLENGGRRSFVSQTTAELILTGLAIIHRLTTENGHQGASSRSIGQPRSRDSGIQECVEQIQRECGDGVYIHQDDDDITAPTVCYGTGRIHHLAFVLECANMPAQSDELMRSELIAAVSLIELASLPVWNSRVKTFPTTMMAPELDDVPSGEMGRTDQMVLSLSTYKTSIFVPVSFATVVGENVRLVSVEFRSNPNGKCSLQVLKSPFFAVGLGGIQEERNLRTVLNWMTAETADMG